jgi:hypothetical protein
VPDPGFSPDARVVVEQVDDENWKVRESFSYTGKYDQTFSIEPGMGTDFASVPRVFVWFLPRYGKYTLAAVLHDHLWRNVVRSGAMDYIDADGIFRRAMRELGVPFARRWIMWAAVRWGALAKPNGLRGWWREAWRVALVTLLALPFLLPPAIAVGSGLAVFYLIEMVLFFPLKAGQAIKERRLRQPGKKVNAPRLDWRT